MQSVSSSETLDKEAKSEVKTPVRHAQLQLKGLERGLRIKTVYPPTSKKPLQWLIVCS